MAILGYTILKIKKKEIDFLLTKNSKPWIPIEVKLNDEEPSINWKPFMNFLNCPYGIQLIKKVMYLKLLKKMVTSLLS
ncbi:MAG: hypothetical protein A3E87_02650 [Gammaproteobacteria bacterium RIFCSPHIGHO2_12_FULL_35_23]|nr:MAG: hypothetical protein A3E87_02650 [Gammaproteobacteria bacterium RIFCSPHIGHO2_12_FULL_35_23]